MNQKSDINIDDIWDDSNSDKSFQPLNLKDLKPQKRLDPMTNKVENPFNAINRKYIEEKKGKKIEIQSAVDKVSVSKGNDENATKDIKAGRDTLLAKNDTSNSKFAVSKGNVEIAVDQPTFLTNTSEVAIKQPVVAEHDTMKYTPLVKESVKDPIFTSQNDNQAINKRAPKNKESDNKENTKFDSLAATDFKVKKETCMSIDSAFDDIKSENISEISNKSDPESKQNKSSRNIDPKDAFLFDKQQLLEEANKCDIQNSKTKSTRETPRKKNNELDLSIPDITDFVKTENEQEKKSKLHRPLKNTEPAPSTSKDIIDEDVDSSTWGAPVDDVYYPPIWNPRRKSDDEEYLLVIQSKPKAKKEDVVLGASDTIHFNNQMLESASSSSSDTEEDNSNSPSQSLNSTISKHNKNTYNEVQTFTHKHAYTHISHTNLSLIILVNLFIFIAF